jgi:hypothetical protein
LSDGTVHVFFSETSGTTGLCARVSLPVSGFYAGPLAVTGWLDKRCLGAWNVTAGTQDAFFGLREPGQVTVKWRLPGGKEQKKSIVVDKKPVRFVINQ